MTSTQDTDTGTQDPANTNPAVGKDVDANGIRTNYLEAGSGERRWCWCTARARA